TYVRTTYITTSFHACKERPRLHGLPPFQRDGPGKGEVRDPCNSAKRRKIRSIVPQAAWDESRRSGSSFYHSLRSTYGLLWGTRVKRLHRRQPLRVVVGQMDAGLASPR